MQKYKCHKVVEAMKIDEMKIHPDGSATFYGSGGQSVTVSLEYQQKHNAFAHGYYIRYKDGYESWSPSEAFEAGYSLINEV
ncbi:MAG: hypothetical protein V3R76_00235 [Gammaproteobacteria bacterium]